MSGWTSLSTESSPSCLCSTALPHPAPARHAPGRRPPRRPVLHLHYHAFCICRRPQGQSFALQQDRTFFTGSSNHFFAKADFGINIRPATNAFTPAGGVPGGALGLVGNRLPAPPALSTRLHEAGTRWPSRPPRGFNLPIKPTCSYLSVGLSPDKKLGIIAKSGVSPGFKLDKRRCGG